MKRKIGLALATGLALLVAGCASQSTSGGSAAAVQRRLRARCGSVNRKKFQPGRQVSRRALGEDARLV